MAAWFKPKVRRRRVDISKRRYRFLAAPERLEKRELLATWSGDILDGTVWSNTEVQEITGNVHIPAGATLTIQPGTVVKFDTYHDWKFDVDGLLVAQGTAANPIYVTSMADDSVGG